MSAAPGPVTVYVGLGANLGDAAATLRAAAHAVGDIAVTLVTGRSGLYLGAPLGPPGQPDYHNAVLRLMTHLGPEPLLDALQGIEIAFGRKRQGPRWGPRTLDLDLLLYGEREIDTPRLRVPHPGLRERPFVLYPLSEIAPDLRLPGGERLVDMLARVPLGSLRRVGNLD